MKSVKILFTFLIFFSSAKNAFCKDYRIEELLEIAEQNSANIRSAEYLAKSQKHFANQQKYWSNPSVSFEKLGGQNTYSINQNVPFYNKLQNKYDIEEAQYQAFDARKNNIALLVKADVFSLSYKFQGLKKKIELTQKRLDRLALVDGYLSKIALSSPTQKAQSQITKDRIKLVERDLIRFNNEIYQTWNAINIYLNLEQQPQNISLQWLSDKNYPGKKNLIEVALQNNWSIKEQRMLINKAKSELSYSKIEQMPDVNVSATRQGADVVDSRAGNYNGVGVSMSIPLINRNQEKIIAAESKIRSEQAALDFVESRLTNMLNGDINQYETALKLSEKFPVSEIDKIISRLVVANADFKKGVLDFITYIELEFQEYQMIETIIDNQVDLANAYSLLMAKVGSFELPDAKK